MVQHFHLPWMKNYSIVIVLFLVIKWMSLVKFNCISKMILIKHFGKHRVDIILLSPWIIFCSNAICLQFICIFPYNFFRDNTKWCSASDIISQIWTISWLPYADIGAFFYWFCCFCCLFLCLVILKILRADDNWVLSIITLLQYSTY